MTPFRRNNGWAANRRAWPDRFWRKVEKTDSCWIWRGGKDSRGYGTVKVSGKKWMQGAHRVAYELLVGPIPPRYVIDHLCRNPSCVNPAHLEAVTQRENLLRGNTLMALTAKRGCCPHGHEWTPENTSIRSNGARRCLACHRERERKRAKKIKEAA